MFDTERYMITSALPYANGPLHIGHLAGAYLPADVYVRFLRMTGKDVVWVCGSDEHGAAITIKASQEGKDPKEIIDKYHELFKIAFEKMAVDFDIYHRTSSQIHHETSQDFFRRLNDNGEFVVQESEQYFDEEAQQFLADRYIVGTCPNCHNEEAYGDQCEKCGSTLSPTELINPKSKLSGAIPIKRKTKHWYLSLDKYEAWLREWIESGTIEGVEYHVPSTWKNHVVGQCKSWLDAGLQPRSMTRDLNWGIDVPSEIEGSAGKKLYVWLDAPIGYISATKQWAIDYGKDWEPYWKGEKTALIHFIAKDNIVFHCLIFPAMLKQHGEFILPKNVPANQFLNLEGRKLSTSKNWAVWVNEYVEEFPDNIDELRYHLIKNMPEQKDSEFTWKGYQESVNNELVNNLANFVNRVVVLSNKYYEGVVPEFDENQDFIGTADVDQSAYAYHETELLQLHDDLQNLNQHIRDYEFRAALNALMNISAKGNQLLQFNEPWKLQKEDPQKVAAIMNLSLQIVAAISVACRPFMPHTSDKLRTMLNMEPLGNPDEYNELLMDLALGEHPLPEGHKIGEATHLFSRIDDEVIAKQKEKLTAVDENNASSAIKAAVVTGATAAATIASNNGSSSVKETISFDDFVKMDIRSATILEAEKVKKADKLLKLKVDLGFEQRTVVSGIAEHFSPEELPGQKISLLANLAPRKIRGVESNGMILLAENEQGKLFFVGADNDCPNGSVIK